VGKVLSPQLLKSWGLSGDTSSRGVSSEALGGNALEQRAWEVFMGTLHASFSQRCQTQEMKFYLQISKWAFLGIFSCRCISSRKLTHACLSSVSSR